MLCRTCDKKEATWFDQDDPDIGLCEGCMRDMVCADDPSPDTIEIWGCDCDESEPVQDKGN